MIWEANLPLTLGGDLTSIFLVNFPILLLAVNQVVEA